MSGSEPCPVCKTASQSQSLGDSKFFECHQCGRYIISRTVISIGIENGRVLSGWIADQNKAGIEPQINTHTIENLKHFREPSLDQKSLRLLSRISEHTEYLGEMIYLDDKKYLSNSYLLDQKELNYVLNYMEENYLIERAAQIGSLGCKILPSGYKKIEELKNINERSKQAFVAMSFSKNMDETYVFGLQKGIQEAGYEAVRVDHKEHINKIDDEIIAEIRKSRFIVADFTEHKHGVYFEAGYALGIGIPVIWTCKEDDLAKLHFDIRQYNTIVWSEYSDLAMRLKNRILASIN